MAKSPAKKEERRQQILACAREAFAEKGYLAVTVDDVVARARIARLGLTAVIVLAGFIALGCTKPQRPTTPSVWRATEGGAMVPCQCPDVPPEQREVAPSRREMMEQLPPVRTAVMACFKGQGNAVVQAVVSNETGRINYVEVEAGSDHDLACIVRAFSRLCFRPFTTTKRFTIRIEFPITGDAKPRPPPDDTPHCASPPPPDPTLPNPSPER